MPIKRLSQSGLLTFAKHSSMLAGNAPLSLGSFDLLETTTLSTSASSVTFSGLGAYSDYKHLQIRLVGRGTNASTASELVSLRLNGDTGTNYANHRLYTDGSTVSSASGTAVNKMWVGNLPRNSGDIFGSAVIDILDFASSQKLTTTRTMSGAVVATGGSIKLTYVSGLWTNTAPVTSVEISLGYDSPTFSAGSRFSLIGIK
jgi:hypothetical protein